MPDLLAAPPRRARQESLTSRRSVLRLDRLEAYTVKLREIAGPGVGDPTAAKAAIVAFADRPVHADSLQAPAENDAMVTATGNYVVVWSAAKTATGGCTSIPGTTRPPSSPWRPRPHVDAASGPRKSSR
jgi:hypothetical protein